MPLQSCNCPCRHLLQFRDSSGRSWRIIFRIQNLCLARFANRSVIMSQFLYLFLLPTGLPLFFFAALELASAVTVCLGRFLAPAGLPLFLGGAQGVAIIIHLIALVCGFSL